MAEHLFTFMGTAAGCGVPSFFCECPACAEARLDPALARGDCGVMVRRAGLPEADTPTLMIDTPPDARHQLLREGVRHVDELLFTHCHFDHIGGLGEYEYLVQLMRRGEKLPVYASPEAMQGIFAEFRYMDYCLDAHMLEPGEAHEHDGVRYRIVDTAGLRRKSKIDESVEYYGFVRAMRAIDRADVALLVIDGTLGVTNEDQRVANYAAERGCALVVVLNKWDIVEGAEAKLAVRDGVAEELQYVDYAPVVALSALTGKNASRLWGAIDEAYADYSGTISTSKLNAWLAEIREGGHTVTKGKTVLRIKYVTQTSTCPPDFTFFCNRPDVVTDNYERFLENRLRRTFPLTGTPVRFRVKKKD